MTKQRRNHNPFSAFIMARSRADNNAQVEPAVVRSRVG